MRRASVDDGTHSTPAFLPIWAYTALEGPVRDRSVTAAPPHLAFPQFVVASSGTIIPHDVGTFLS
jgi:hypothetical protein